MIVEAHDVALDPAFAHERLLASGASGRRRAGDLEACTEQLELLLLRDGGWVAEADLEVDEVVAAEACREQVDHRDLVELADDGALDHVDRAREAHVDLRESRRSWDGVVVAEVGRGDLERGDELLLDVLDVLDVAGVLTSLEGVDARVGVGATDRDPVVLLDAERVVAQVDTAGRTVEDLRALDVRLGRLHVVGDLVRGHAADVDIEHATLRRAGDAVDEHGVLDEDELTPDASGAVEHGRAVRQVLVVAHETEVGDLPVLERTVAERHPAEAHGERIMRVEALFARQLVDRDGDDVDDAVLGRHVDVQVEVTVLAQVACPGTKVELSVEGVVEQLLEVLLDGRVVGVDVERLAGGVLRHALVSVDVQRRVDLGVGVHLVEVLEARHALLGDVPLAA